jgi:23S rRNA (adenine2503-C2)-methyltransferase
MIRIVGATGEEFASQVEAALGKGYYHALKYYKFFFKKGDGLLAYDENEPQSKSLFESIHDLVEFPKWEIQREQISSLTEKYVLKLSDGLIAELVVIPMKTGLTLCVSSQVGCKMACAFCETGRMGKLRDLSSYEILTQVFFAKYGLKKNIRNIVFMGMGEPFDNYDELEKSLHCLLDQKGFHFAPSRITVSTSGVLPRILDFIKWGQKGVKLAISLNGSNSSNRTQVMPITRKYSFDDLIDTLKIYSDQTTQTILVEYVMLEGINDYPECADELQIVLKSIPCIINLIPYNAQSVDKFKSPSSSKIKEFQNKLIQMGFKVYVRQNKGDQIMAACGQLGQLDLKKRLLQKP